MPNPIWSGSTQISFTTAQICFVTNQIWDDAWQPLALQSVAADAPNRNFFHRKTSLLRKPASLLSDCRFCCITRRDFQRSNPEFGRPAGNPVCLGNDHFPRAGNYFHCTSDRLHAGPGFIRRSRDFPRVGSKVPCDDRDAVCRRGNRRRSAADVFCPKPTTINKKEITP